MGAVGVVHGHHVGEKRHGADEAVVIGHHVQPAMGLDQVHRVVDVADADAELVLDRVGPGGLVKVLQPRRGVGDREAVAGAALLRRGRERGKDRQGGEDISNHG